MTRFSCAKNQLICNKNAQVSRCSCTICARNRVNNSEHICMIEPKFHRMQIRTTIIVLMNRWRFLKWFRVWHFHDNSKHDCLLFTFANSPKKTVKAIAWMSPPPQSSKPRTELRRFGQNKFVVSQRNSTIYCESAHKKLNIEILAKHLNSSQFPVPNRELTEAEVCTCHSQKI